VIEEREILMKHMFMCGAAVAVALCADAAMAQQAAPAPTPTPSNGDIVVTATRQSTLLSKTPVAMTAVTGEGLRSAGVTDARALAQVTPNLAITESGDGLRIAIRGVTSTDGTEKGDPSAAFLLDGIYIARSQDQQGSFYDVSQVEVLRGPQGTLYGRNTTAGVVNVQSNRPKAKWEGSFDAKYGNLNSQNFTGMINAPVSDTLGVRLAMNYDRQDNNLRESVSNPQYSINPGRKLFSTRLSFGGDLGKLHFVVRGDYSIQRGTMTNVVPLSNVFSNTGTVGQDPTYRSSQSGTAMRTLPYGQTYPSYKWYTNKGIMGEATYALGNSVDVTYLGSYRNPSMISCRTCISRKPCRTRRPSGASITRTRRNCVWPLARGTSCTGRRAPIISMRNRTSTTRWAIRSPASSIPAPRAMPSLRARRSPAPRPVLASSPMTRCPACI
jgi:iron complex outermembrane receptor protein